VEDATLTIGEIARRAGMKTSAIRFYESVGVLPEPERVGGQRRYNEAMVRRLQMIDVAKRAGFSLDEAASLFAAGTERAPAATQLRALAEQKLPEVRALIERAQAMAAWLGTATGCDCETLDACKLFEPSALEAKPAGRALSIHHVGGR
jgi:MerR family transcriptional regulator, redox-sensitive transcriptional activator SoxR